MGEGVTSVGAGDGSHVPINSVILYFEFSHLCLKIVHNYVCFFCEHEKRGYSATHKSGQRRQA